MNKIPLAAISLVFALLAHPVFAAENAGSGGYTYWLELGLIGKSYSSDVNGYGDVFKIAVSKDRNIISFRNLYHHNGDDIFVCIWHAMLLSTCDGPDIEIEDQALLFGRRLKNHDLAFSAGIAEAKGTYADRPGKDFTATGLAFDIDWRFGTKRYHGYSVNLSGNINKEQSFYGAYFTFIFGKLE